MEGTTTKHKGEQLYIKALQKQRLCNQQSALRSSQLSFRPSIYSQRPHQPFQQRYSQWKELQTASDTKKKQIRQQLAKKDESSCPFKPQVNTTSFTQNHPGSSFSERNKEWLDLKASKLDRLKQEIAEKKQFQFKQNCTFVPKSNPETKRGQNLQHKKVTGVEEYLDRQDRARMLQKVKTYRKDNPNWHLWNHHPKDTQSLQMLCKSQIIPKTKESYRSSNGPCHIKLNLQ